MADDSDADRILRERERLRALERHRIDEARRARRSELVRVGLPDPWEVPTPGEADDDDDVPTVVIEPSRGPARPSDRAAAPDPQSGPASAPSRTIGGSLLPTSVVEFLRTDPTERFDIQALNALRLPGAIDVAGTDPAMLASLARRAGELMARVKQEIDDPLSAGAFLRDQTRRWYRESLLDPGWSSAMPERWGGLFADSRVSGGRLKPWLNRRLGHVREQAVRSGPIGMRLRRGLARDRSVDAPLARTAHQQILAEVAQAFLDDLAAHPRAPDTPLPLVRLSELAVRREVPTVNDALALLFSAPESGPFIVLHPNRYPDCDELILRPPVGGASGAALAYSLVLGRAARKGLGRGTGSSATERAGPEGEGSATGDGEAIDAESIWQAETVGPGAWRRLLDERRRERKRLDPPPKDCRNRPAYGALRSLLAEDGEARRSFLAVRWRGRPAGLPLVAALLQKGALAPDVATDHEYLEAELGELAQGDPEWHPQDGRWSIPGWTVVREGSHREGFRFRAQPAPAPGAG
jgi:hypothetical protein